MKNIKTIHLVSVLAMLILLALPDISCVNNMKDRETTEVNNLITEYKLFEVNEEYCAFTFEYPSTWLINVTKNEQYLTDDSLLAVHVFVPGYGARIYIAIDKPKENSTIVRLPLLRSGADDYKVLTLLSSTIIGGIVAERDAALYYTLNIDSRYPERSLIQSFHFNHGGLNWSIKTDIDTSSEHLDEILKHFEHLLETLNIVR